MDQDIFTYICKTIREFAKKRNTNFRKAVTVEMGVAISLYIYDCIDTGNSKCKG